LLPIPYFGRDVSTIKYVKDKGLYVSYFLYDTTRAEVLTLRKLLSDAAKKSYSELLAIVDTTDCALPEAIKILVQEIKKTSDLPIEIHAYQDFGLAVENLLAAIEPGGEVVHVYVNGLVNRCGNAALEEIVVCLKTL
jgi:methanogen homocitrate synthase